MSYPSSFPLAALTSKLVFMSSIAAKDTYEVEIDRLCTAPPFNVATLCINIYVRGAKEEGVVYSSRFNMNVKRLPQFGRDVEEDIIGEFVNWDEMEEILFRELLEESCDKYLSFCESEILSFKQK
jgi:hypothetical protein